MSDEKQHPLEKALDIEPGSTPSLITVAKGEPAGATVPVATSPYSVTDPDSGEVVELPVEEVSAAQVEREERIDDLRIDGQLTEVYDKAKAAFNYYISSVEQVEPRYAARHGEVAAQFLNIALSTTNSRTSAKYQRNKLRLAKQLSDKPRSVQNNLIVADRNDVLRQVFKPDFEKTMAETLQDELNPASDVEKVIGESTPK